MMTELRCKQQRLGQNSRAFCKRAKTPLSSPRLNPAISPAPELRRLLQHPTSTTSMRLDYQPPSPHMELVPNVIVVPKPRYSVASWSDDSVRYCSFQMATRYNILCAHDGLTFYERFPVVNMQFYRHSRKTTAMRTHRGAVNIINVSS